MAGLGDERHCRVQCPSPVCSRRSISGGMGYHPPLLAKFDVAVIAFSGGEPLSRPDILQLICRAHEQRIYVALATNGTLIPPKRATEMRNASADHVQISIDGADTKTYDEFRGISGAFDRTIEGVKNAVDAGFFVNISTTATRANLDQIPRIVDLCSDLGVN